jgi:VanZ family protein
VFRKILRLAAWSAVVTITVLSLVPGPLRPHTGAPGYLEHVAAYCITAALFTLSYPRCNKIVIIVSLSFCAAVLEIGQLYVPGRVTAVPDWIAGSFGALIGTVASTFILRLWLQLTDET